MGSRVKTLEKAGTPSNKGTKGVKKGYNGSQDFQKGEQAIQEGVQRESRPLRRRTRNPKKGQKGSQRNGTVGVKTLEKASNQGVERELSKGEMGIKTHENA